MLLPEYNSTIVHQTFKRSWSTTQMKQEQLYPLNPQMRISVGFLQGMGVSARNLTVSSRETCSSHKYSSLSYHHQKGFIYSIACLDLSKPSNSAANAYLSLGVGKPDGN